MLTAWSTAGFTVYGQDGQVGPSGELWVAGELATLPSLERLVLAWTTHLDDAPVTLVDRTLFVFACRCHYMRWPQVGTRKSCDHCRQATACAGAAAVRELITHGLPAAGAAAGRRLAVVVDDRFESEWSRGA